MSDAKKPRYRQHLFICEGKRCSANGNPEGAKRFFKDKIKEHGLAEEVRACTASCLDLCDMAPNIVVYPEGTWYSHVAEKDWPELFEKVVLEGKRLERLVNANPTSYKRKKESSSL